MSAERESGPVRLWLDDVRPAPDQTWVSCRTTAEAMKAFESHTVREVSLDNDLGGREREGRDLVRWMETERLWPTQRIRVHSSNAVASGAMCNAIERTGLFVAVPGRARTYGRPTDDFENYANTRIELRGEDGHVTTLCPGMPPAPSLNQDLPFAVLTAHNPLSLRLTDEQNARAHRELLTRLDRLPARQRWAVGRARDGSHAEEGVAVWGLGLEAASSLACDFGQRAIFWVDHCGVTVRDCSPIGVSLTGEQRLDCRVFCDAPDRARAMSQGIRRALHGELAIDSVPRLLSDVGASAHEGWLCAVLARATLKTWVVLP